MHKNSDVNHRTSDKYHTFWSRTSHSLLESSVTVPPMTIFVVCATLPSDFDTSGYNANTSQNRNRKNIYILFNTLKFKLITINKLIMPNRSDIHGNLHTTENPFFQSWMSCLLHWTSRFTVSSLSLCIIIYIMSIHGITDYQLYDKKMCLPVSMVEMFPLTEGGAQIVVMSAKFFIYFQSYT